MEPVIELFEQAARDSRKPQGAYKQALSGSETRQRLLSLIEEADNDIGQRSIIIAADRILVHRRITELIEQVDYEVLSPALNVSFPQPESKRRIVKQWPSVIVKYQGRLC